MGKMMAASRMWNFIRSRGLPSAVFITILISKGQSVFGGNDVWTGSGSLGGAVTALVVDPVEHNIVYAGVDSVGVMKSTDSGKTWAVTGSGIANLKIVSLVMDPADRKTLYVGSLGLYKTKDSGGTWNSTGLTSVVPYGIVVHPHDPNTLYVGTDSQGVLKSTDGGTNFSPATSGLLSTTVMALAIDPQNPNVLYAGGNLFDGNVSKSTDGGAHWTPKGRYYFGGTIVVDPQDNRIIYAGISKSTDQGEHWSYAFNNCISGGIGHLLGFALAIDPMDHNTIHLAAECSYYRSNDGGGYWAPWYEGLPSTAYPRLLCIAVDSLDHNVIYAGTTNAGVYTIKFTKEIPAGLNVVQPNGGEQWVAGSQKSIYWGYTGEISDISIELSTDGGASFSPIATLVLPDSSPYLWTIPNSISSQCLIRIKETNGPVSAVSAANFSIIEAQPPTFSFHTPTDGSIVNGSVTLELTGADPAKTSFYVDGYSSSKVWDTTRYLNGLHRIRAEVLDDHGFPTSIEITATIKNTTPTFQSTRILPSSARAAGLGGAFYTTDLTLSNNGLADADITLRFAGHDGDGSQGPTRSYKIEAGRTITFSDVLKSVFQLDSGYGAIHLISGNWDLTFQGQTSTPGAGGTFGQSVPGLRFPQHFTSTNFRMFIVGAREDAFFRTNLILANAVSIAVDVLVSVISETGERLGSKSYRLSPLGMTQVTKVIRELGIPQDVAVATLELSTPTLNGGFGAYASVIDNVTNDPRTLLPSSGHQVIPATARAGGSGGAFYTTDVTLFNLSPKDVRVIAQFAGHDGDGRNGIVRRFKVPAGATASYRDVLHSLFGLDSGYGAIRLAESAVLLCQTQTSTPGAGGTFGQSVPLTVDNEFVLTGVPRYINGVREDAAFRTNLILTNASEIASDVDVTLFDSNGQMLASQRVHLLPLGMTQLTRLVRLLGVGQEIRDARLMLSTPTTGASIAVYASAIDNVTNDPRTLTPQTGPSSP